MTDRYARYEQLQFDRPHPRVLRITMASPLKLNAMTATLHRECSEIWRDVDADPSVSAVIIRGSDKAFSAGGDLAHERKTCDDYDMRMQAGIALSEIPEGLQSGLPTDHGAQALVSTGKFGGRFCKNASMPSFPSGPAKPMNSNASEASKMGPAWRNQ